MDKFREECGLFGIWNNSEASNLTYLGLYAQQHRGQEGAGVVSLKPGGKAQFFSHKNLGLVQEVFEEFDFTRLEGSAAIGHIRYATAGGGRLQNVQPFLCEIATGQVALAHNGNLINADELRTELIQKGAIFGSTSDTEVILHLLSRGKKNAILSETIVSALEKIKGAYSLLMLFEDRLVAVRDPNGIRPLVLGKLGESFVVASETCAFDLVGAEFLREIEAGELIEISGHNDLKSYFPFGFSQETPCVFEYIYFARPDSQVFGRNVYEVRKRLGMELAIDCPAKADLVVPCPDSGVPAALGYAQQLKIPFEYGLIRNHYIGRTFIEPKQSIRDFGVKIKLNANCRVLEGKSIVVVDDSIVRGTTSKKLVQMLRKAGAREVHMRISSPPTIDACYYGVDTPSKEELIGALKSVSEIQEYIEVDSIGYLSLEAMYRAIGSPCGRFCDACFSGIYPVGIPGSVNKRQQLSIFPSNDR